MYIRYNSVYRTHTVVIVWIGLTDIVKQFLALNCHIG